ncbi:mRNA export factor Gle1 [Toxorhynchites rutilus septentrionalis]|uniref:mRNA export factor Gle1 n=1 Tax=Toxorhynchites rutilus septentrionalis TaxID=329112 RepID=UPI002479D6C0|nr:mRNA export factor Gle1 [Toxorhynchites rutilus septentrionalis]
MDNLSFDIEELLSDVESLKISALTHAANITPFIEGRTIGAGCNPAKNGDQSESNRLDTDPSDQENIKYAPDLKITFSNRADSVGSYPNSRQVGISECRAVSVRMYQQDVERKRIQDVQKELAERHARVREADRLRDSQLEEKLRKAELDVARRIREKEQKLLDDLREQERVANELERQRLAEIESENKRSAEKSQLLKRQEEEKRRKLSMLTAIFSHHTNFHSMTDDVTKMLAAVDKDYANNFSKEKKVVQALVRSFEQLLHGVNINREATQPDVDKAGELCKYMEKTIAEVAEMMSRIQAEIAERVKKEAEQQTQAAQKQEQGQQQQSVAVAAVPATQDTTDTSAVPKATQQISSQPHPLAAFVSQESLAFYMGIKSFYEQHQTAVKALLEDASMKAYRFNCQKVINTPVNAISVVSREHFVDKFNKLDALLGGQSIKIGDTAVSINGHPLGRVYCTMLLAKKFVSQADTMISSNAPAAFPIAAIVVGLWQKYPDFGKFFLAYLHKECPYLVPYFLPQLEGQTQDDYLKGIGYRFSSEGVLEKQDQYLKRMTGLARLYAAVIVSNPRRGESAPHPHGLEYGWKWLCNILNLGPLPDICATLITEMLQTTGGMLWATYGKQFVKLLRLMQEQYLPALKKVDEGGPKARLEGLVGKIASEGRIDRPEGMFSPDFW